MNDALFVAATGMQGQQLNVNTIANNIANVNTNGFKAGRVNFADLVARDGTPIMQNAATQEAGALAAPARLGLGLGVTSVAKLLEQGEIKKTDSDADLAISGVGFLEVTLPDGTSAFTRGGTLKVNADGLLATASGYPLKHAISVPEGTQRVTIQADGRVQLRPSDQSAAIDAGQLELVRFRDPAALTSLGDGLFAENENTGSPISGNAGQDGLGMFAQGFLEGSNVKLTDEMVNLMVAQRAYEASAKVAQSADEMLAMANNLRK
ncbi:MAG: flagellar basal-body rod protein FlgG [Rhodocyclaceae bacterium]